MVCVYTPMQTHSRGHLCARSQPLPDGYQLLKIDVVTCVYTHTAPPLWIVCVCLVASVVSVSLQPHGSSPPGSSVHGIPQARLLRVPWTERRSTQSILEEINPEYSLEGLMLKLKLQYFGHLMQRADSGKDPDAGKD